MVNRSSACRAVFDSVGRVGAGEGAGGVDYRFAGLSVEYGREEGQRHARVC